VKEPEKYQLQSEKFPNLIRWRDEIAGRPAVQRGLDVLGEILAEFKKAAKTKEVQATLFGVGQSAAK
jgi:hypothetical protein